MSDASRHADPLMPTEEVSIGKVFHLGGQWRAAIRIDDALVLVARSRGEGFYIADDLASPRHSGRMRLSLSRSATPEQLVVVLGDSRWAVESG